MPYPNEHAARVRDPGAFIDASFRRKKLPGSGVSIIMGKLKAGGKMQVQAYRFPKDKYTASQAKKWLKDNDVKHISFEAASESKEISDPPEFVEEEQEVKAKMYDGEVAIASYIPLGATSFADVDEYIIAEAVGQRVQELTRQFQTLAGNILYTDEIADKGSALNGLVSELDARLGEAIKPKGMFGLLKEAMRSQLIGVKDGGEERIREDLAIDKEKAKPSGGLFLWKEGDVYRWLAVYSNKYLDRDSPPEIISEAAHREFIAAVERKEASYPELWHFHVPGTRYGQADMLAYDANGFVVASGTIDKGHEAEADILSKREDVRVSHGMLLSSVEYDPKEKNVITRYRSIEISDLPLHRAANPLTGFYMMKEGGTMGLPKDKKEYLKSVGMSDDAIATLEAEIERKAATAKEAGLASKEGEAPAPEVTPTGEAPASAPKPDETTTPPGESAPAVAPPITLETVASAVAQVVQSVVEPLLGRVSTLEAAALKEKKTDEQRIGEKAADTPAASIAALVMQSLSVRNSPTTKLPEDWNPVGPKEVEATEARTGLPWLDKVLSEPAKK